MRWYNDLFIPSSIKTLGYIHLKSHVIRNMTGAKQHAWLRKEYLTGSLFLSSTAGDFPNTIQLMFCLPLTCRVTTCMPKNTACMQKFSLFRKLTWVDGEAGGFKGDLKRTLITMELKRLDTVVKLSTCSQHCVHKARFELTHHSYKAPYPPIGIREA